MHECDVRVCMCAGYLFTHDLWLRIHFFVFAQAWVRAAEDQRVEQFANVSMTGMARFRAWCLLTTGAQLRPMSREGA